MVSLVAILIIGLFAMSAATLNLLGALKENTKNHNSIKSAQAFFTAESAAREGVYEFRNSASFNAGDPYYNGGNYSLLNYTSNAVMAVENFAGWPTGGDRFADLVGTADNSTSTRKIVYSVNLYPEGDSFDHAIYADDELDISGSANITGNVFANNDIDLGGNAVVDGNVVSTNDVDITGSAEITNGEAVPAGTEIPAPSIDLAPYKTIALAAGTFYDDKDIAEDQVKNNLLPYNSTVYVDDIANRQTSIASSGTNFTGTLVVDGDLKISGGTYRAVNDAAIIVNGDLELAGGAQIYGIVYVTGITTMTGTASGTKIQGSLISLGEVDLNGNSSVEYDAAYVSVWSNIIGLDHISAEKPRITFWEEE